MKSIRTTMLLSFSVLILATLISFSVISINYTEQAILRNSIDYTLKLVRQLNNDIDSYIDYMENISDMVVHSADVSDYFFGSLYGAEKEQCKSRILTQFNTVVEARKDITNIAVVTMDGESIINQGKDVLNPHVNVQDLDWFAGAAAQSGTRLSVPHVQNAIRDNYQWVVTMSRAIEAPEAAGSAGGVFLIDLNYRVINDLCESNRLGSDSYIFIMNKEGKIIYHPQQQLLYRGLKTERIQEVLSCRDSYFITKDGQDSTLYTMYESEKTGWLVVGVDRMTELLRARKQAQNIYLLSACVLLLAAVLLATFISREITRPLKRLKDSMRQVEQGDFEGAGIRVQGEGEIGSLSKSFNLMTEKIKQLMDENIHEQEQKRLSELRALQSQINPHFLYNTLDSIIWMAEGGKNREVVLMTSSLARLLRQSISNEKELVSIAQEIGYVNSYLTIQKMRYKDKLEFEIDVDKALYEERIIKLVLQPLVENAIYHGIKYKEEKGLIRITGHAQGANLVLRVEDNGRGMDEETLSHIFEEKISDSRKNGVGVHNVQMRLKLYYGKEYGLSFESVRGKGTIAVIVIPKATREEGEDEADQF